METRIICLKHLREFAFKYYMQGMGDCTTCVPDEKNKMCSGYYPIKMAVLDDQKTTQASS